MFILFQLIKMCACVYICVYIIYSLHIDMICIYTVLSVNEYTPFEK